MGKAGTQHYETDGVCKDFYFKAFNAAFDAYQKAHEGTLNKSELERSLGEAVGVEQSTVHNWRLSRNAPSSLDIVETIAGYLGVETEGLLIDHREVATMDRLTDRQRGAIARVYREIEDYLYLFVHTNGFAWPEQRIMEGSTYANYVNAYTDESSFVRNDSKRQIGFVSNEAMQHMIYEAARGHVFREGADLAEAGYWWVCHSLQREWVELGAHPVYEELYSYIVDALSDVWGGKADLDYRMHNTDPELSEDYEAAQVLKRVQEIIGKYL